MKPVIVPFLTRVDALATLLANLNDKPENEDQVWSAVVCLAGWLSDDARSILDNLDQQP